MPDDLGETHILVNVPAFHLVVREHGRPALDMRVVVGKDGEETPIFSSRMASIVFSPYWNVPDSIGEGEVIPAAARIRTISFETSSRCSGRRSGGNAVIDADAVNWSDAKTVKPLAVPAEAGPSERARPREVPLPQSLRCLPARHAVRRAVCREGRAFSHGCVRLEHSRGAREVPASEPARMDRREDRGGDGSGDGAARAADGGGAGPHRLLHRLAAGRRRRGYLARRLRPRRPTGPGQGRAPGRGAKLDCEDVGAGEEASRARRSQPPRSKPARKPAKK